MSGSLLHSSDVPREKSYLWPGLACHMPVLPPALSHLHLCCLLLAVSDLLKVFQGLVGSHLGCCCIWGGTVFADFIAENTCTSGVALERMDSSAFLR